VRGVACKSSVSIRYFCMILAKTGNGSTKFSSSLQYQIPPKFAQRFSGYFHEYRRAGQLNIKVSCYTAPCRMITVTSIPTIVTTPSLKSSSPSATQALLGLLNSICVCVFWHRGSRQTVHCGRDVPVHFWKERPRFLHCSPVSLQANSHNVPRRFLRRFASTSFANLWNF
jgi:hypothetical protein